MMLFTWKNIGMCYLLTGQCAEAKKMFEKCIDLLKSLPIDSVNEQEIKKDKQELANLSQNMYLSDVSDRKYD